MINLFKVTTGSINSLAMNSMVLTYHFYNFVDLIISSLFYSSSVEHLYKTSTPLENKRDRSLEISLRDHKEKSK